MMRWLRRLEPIVTLPALAAVAMLILHSDESPSHKTCELICITFAMSYAFERLYKAVWRS